MKSLREDLAEQLDAPAVTETTTTEKPDPALPSGAAAGSEAASSEPPGQASETTTETGEGKERGRGPDGKFVKADATATAAAPITGAADATPPTQDAAGATQAAVPATDRPPDSLTAGIKAQWATMPPEIKAEFAKREEDFHKGIEQYKQGHQFGSQVYQAIQPFLPMIQSQGSNPLQAIGALLQTAYDLQTNPQATLARLAQNYGVTELPHGQNQQIDPALQKIQQENLQLRQNFNQLQQQVTQPMYQQRLREVEAVANDAKNLYFKDVFPTMKNLIASGEATSAQDAYDKACRVNPAVWSAITAQQLKDAEKKRIADAQLASAKAKQAALDVSGTGTAGSAKPNESLREELGRRYG